MVLKQLIALWHGETPLKKIFKQFDEMIVIAENMFDLATSYLSGSAKDVHKRITEMDGKLNALEQTIRRDIVTHISVQGANDIIPCFLLISLIKDAERIGDYCKNIDEIFRHAQNMMGDPLLSDIKDKRDKILKWFEQTKRAFDTCDQKLARLTREEAYKLEKTCDRQIWDLAADNKERNAVAVALMLRFFKRITAHLGNICTSVMMPFDKLDYFEKSGGKPGELIEDE